jgi:hypothetical protein
MSRKAVPSSRIARACGATALTLAAATAQALDYQVHGFAAQGYSLSHGANFDGQSTGSGSTDYYELGLNGAVALTADLLASAQVLDRRAGATDTEGVRLDYAQLDYRALSSSKYNAGLRLGRVRNPYGFYSEARDVVFTRPGIDLPDSVYLENAGLRSVLFSRDGVQWYGGIELGQHYLTLVASYALDQRLSSKQQLQVLQEMQLPIRIKVRNFNAERLEDEWNGGVLKFALSHLGTNLLLEPDPGAPFTGDASFNFWVASVRYNARRFSLTGEYQVEFEKNNNTLFGTVSQSSDGFYLQGEYQIVPHWSALLRYSAEFANRHDRDGRQFAAQTGGDRYSQFAHDETIGVNWLPTPHWGLWVEFHLIQGTMSVPGDDNISAAPLDHSNLLQVMGAYRF